MKYQVMTDLSAASAVVSMMGGLYAEDVVAGGSAPDANHFEKTIRTLLDQPLRGSIYLFAESDPVGYAILIPYWSNEFGGLIVFIDEVYVKPELRGQKIGRGFFEFLEREKPWDAVAIMLEVSASNARARRLYTELGFEPRTHATLVKGIDARL